ncbi:MAG: ribosome maturation factor RimP [Solirubrobacterales bacterium]|nr:ribosome maturation factor RimP [Solirubrobacterales bacterium]
MEQHHMDQLQRQIETRIAEVEPDVELIALERPAKETLRLYIDHPAGVELDLCERVTRGLGELLDDYALEVSSPGLDRPLTKPAHYERFAGHRVVLRTAEPIEGRRNFTGRIAGVDDARLVLEVEGGSREIPFDKIFRSNLVPEPSEVSS